MQSVHKKSCALLTSVGVTGFFLFFLGTRISFILFVNRRRRFATPTVIVVLLMSMSRWPTITSRQSVGNTKCQKQPRFGGGEEKTENDNNKQYLSSPTTYIAHYAPCPSVVCVCVCVSTACKIHYFTLYGTCSSSKHVVREILRIRHVFIFCFGHPETAIIIYFRGVTRPCTAP